MSNAEKQYLNPKFDLISQTSTLGRRRWHSLKLCSILSQGGGMIMYLIDMNPQNTTLEAD
jgi:hypothetical protein|tara:strand:+ start:518 stop:697 length:180 start_codon:yes stop_codon:yes gene_type:complete